MATKHLALRQETGRARRGKDKGVKREMDEGRRGRGRPEGEREWVGECEKERNGGGRKGREQ